MEKNLHVLIVEDLPSDVELAERELRTVLKNYVVQVVDTEEGFDQALKIFKPDLIISDYQMPAFDGLSALKIRQEKSPFTPFIILTGSMNEDTAVECMKEGADDYVIKEHIKRLGSAVLKAFEKKNNELERKQAQEELRKLSTAVQQSPSVIVITDLKGNLEYVNPKFTELTGYTSEKAIGKNARILKSGEQADEIYQELWNTITSGKVWHGEFHNKKKNGELFWEAASISPVFDKQGKITNYLKVAEDITKRKRAEQIQKVLYNISSAVITTDNLNELIGLIQKELGTIIDTTNFYVALYDHKTDMILLPFFIDEKDEIPPFTAGKTLTNYVIKTQKSLLATKKELEVLEASGEIESFGTDSEIWLGVPLKIEGKVTGVLAVQSYTNENAFNVSDMEMLEFVSDQISISVERKKAEQALRNALEKATESDRLKSAFLATMSHELRTPLNAIMGFSDIINENMSIEKIIKFNKIINSSGNQLLNIVEDIFDIILIQSNEIEIQKSEENLHTILRNIHEIIKAEQQRTNKNNLDLNLTIPPEGKEMIINTDFSKLKQILINLLKNALKFTHEGHVRYGFEIKTNLDKPILKFFVEDTGIGIPKDKQEFIFNVFRQVEDSNTRMYGGTGIGLSISKKLTEFLGGKIWLESEEGKGCTFYFTIPYKEIELAYKKNETEAEKNNTFKKKTILVVEDDEKSFEFLKILLEKPEIRIIWAKDGAESIKLCKENTYIDLVLMDINMLVMDGYTATKEIKKFRPELPIIAQTAYAIAGDREKTFEAGCDDYISKPIKKEKLMEKIRNFLGES